ncbi:MAG: hypothetical protein K6F54_13010 [Lachnospiraceae bacterium]|nr:hypothetical protein [Lachnospiraceae bacterium]
MHRIKKGEYGYIASTRRLTIIRTVFYFALCAAIFIIGYVTTGTRRNLLTIVAVLGCLPAAKSLVNTIMFIRARGCDEDTHVQIEEVLKDADEVSARMKSAYDLYMTTYNKNYPVSHLTVYGNMVTGLIPGADTDTLNGCEKHIDERLKQESISGLNIKIFGDTGKYVSRLGQLSGLEAGAGPDPGRILDTLKSVSL